MRPRRSLRRDLSLGLGLGIAALWLAAAGGAWIVLRGEVDEIYDAALSRTAEWLAAAPAASVVSPPAPREGMSYLRRTRAGEVLARSGGATGAIFGDLPETGFRTRADHRILGLDMPDGAILEVADPLSERREAAREALTGPLLVGLVLAPLIALGAAGFVSWRLRPIRDFAAAVAQRDSGYLAPVETLDLRAEFMPIEEAVNRLMGRLADALEAERAFSANAAHELRTPIAATLAQTQRLVAEAPEGPLRDRARAIETELKRMARLAGKLLDLARAEGAGGAAGASEDLRPILSLVVDEFRAGAGLCPVLPSAPVAAAIDADTFAILARNLIENALLHGAPPVEVTLDPGPGLRVASGGPPIPPERLALITRRFERLGSRRQGSGLGLAIVETLARKTGARLEFQSPIPGHADGLLVRVALPPATVLAKAGVMRR